MEMGPSATIHGAVEAQARDAASAERIAVVDGDVTVSFKELDGLANQLARNLLSRGPFARHS